MRRLILFGLGALASALLPATALAEDMTFFMKNSHAAPIVIELRSQDRDLVWPGGGKVYLLENGEKKSVPIVCDRGERICYGAWVRGDDSVAWGVGPDGDKTCDTCCRICVGGATETLDIGG